MKVGKRVAQNALQASSVLTQSKLCYIHVSDRQLMSGYSMRTLSNDADCKYSDNDCYNDDNHKLFFSGQMQQLVQVDLTALATQCDV